MRDVGVQLAPMIVVEGQISSVSLLLHVDNHLYTTINPGPVYSLFRYPRCDDAQGVLGMEDDMNFYLTEVCLYVLWLYISSVLKIRIKTALLIVKKF